APVTSWYFLTGSRSKESSQVQPVVQPDRCPSERVHWSSSTSSWVGESWHFATLYPEITILYFVRVLKESARRRSGRARTVLVVDSAVAGAHKQSRFLEPPHRAAKVRAVDREDLKLVCLRMPHPARNIE